MGINECMSLVLLYCRHFTALNKIECSYQWMFFVTDFNNYEQVYCDSNLGKDSISTKVMKTNFNNYKL